MNAPTSAPANWRDMYNFSGNGVQQNMSPYMQNLWSHNIGNAAKETIATNFMPYVMNPASISLDPAVNKANMYSGGAGASAGGAPGMGAPGASDPMTQILGLLQSNPEVLSVLLPILQQQGGGMPQMGNTTGG